VFQILEIKTLLCITETAVERQAPNLVVVEEILTPTVPTTIPVVVQEITHQLDGVIETLVDDPTTTIAVVVIVTVTIVTTLVVAAPRIQRVTIPELLRSPPKTKTVVRSTTAMQPIAPP